MPLFYRDRSARLLASWLVLVLSPVCPAWMENIVSLQPPCCLLSIRLAIFVLPLLLLCGIGNFWVFWYIHIVYQYSVPLLWLLCQLTRMYVCMYVCMCVCGGIRDIGQNILQSSFQKGSSSSSPSYFQIFFLIVFLDGAFIRNIRFILCNNGIFIICINDNNAVINNYGKPPDLILHFIATRKDLFEIYRQFGHAFSKRYASPILEHSYKNQFNKLCGQHLFS